MVSQNPSCNPSQVGNTQGIRHAGTGTRYQQSTQSTDTLTQSPMNQLQPMMSQLVSMMHALVNNQTQLANQQRSHRNDTTTSLQNDTSSSTSAIVDTIVDNNIPTILNNLYIMTKLMSLGLMITMRKRK
jgi:hypothetical protein